MKKSVKMVIVSVVFAICLVTLVIADLYLWKLVGIGTGIEAKVLASGVFVSGRVPNKVIEDDLHKAVNFIHLEVDQMNNVTTATAFGLLSRTAYHRSGLGCTLLSGMTEDELRNQLPASMIRTPKKKAPSPWPDGDRLPDDPPPEGVDMASLNAAIDKAFKEAGSDDDKNTRAVVVVHDGRLIAERYKTSFTEYTPLLGYGMTQIAINALTGILVHKGLLTVDDSAGLSEWNESGDLRAAITMDHLMRMTSGLSFNDLKLPLRDTVIMHSRADMAAYAAEKELLNDPGEHWSYSNGAVNIVSKIIRRTLETTGSEYLSFPRTELFGRIGMQRAVLEPDASGTFIGSTYMYATARDWARLGMLYLNDGVWNGERIFPADWVEYSTRPTLASQGGMYGALVWLHPDGLSSAESWRPSALPGDSFFAIGHNGQSLTVIPSKKLVIVRLGMTKVAHNWNLEAFLLDIIDSLSDDAL